MGDSSTCIWYLKGEDDVYISNFGDVKWNSKKWRMLFYFSEDWDICFLGRQYPFEISGIIDYIAKKLPTSDYWMPFINDQLNEFPVKNPEYSYAFSLDKPYIALSGDIWNSIRLYRLSDVIKDAETELHYNDLLYSSYYVPYYSSKIRKYKSKKPPKIIVGSDVKCVCCGQNYINRGERFMLCTDCEISTGHTNNYVRCACCGEYVNIEDVHYLHNDDPVCDRCIESEDIIYCDDCGEYFYREEVRWSEKYERFFCERCFSEIADEEAEYCKEHGLYTEDQLNGERLRSKDECNSEDPVCFWF